MKHSDFKINFPKTEIKEVNNSYKVPRKPYQLIFNLLQQTLQKKQQGEGVHENIGSENFGINGNNRINGIINMKTSSIIVCSIRPDEAERLRRNIEATIGVPFEFIAYDNRGTGKGICQVYNQYIFYHRPEGGSSGQLFQNQQYKHQQG